ncbi:MAG TPA: hypothetical protein VEG64_16345 [Candidatus Sulfotelmatobacter sp.]|nr:hypothetical protein [Candidatus Sulfotelmatobacter sp.]
MSWKFVPGLFLFFFGLALLMARPLNAQSSGCAISISMDPSVPAPAYDISEEIRVQGAVSGIEAVDAGGVIGVHIQLQAPSGPVDVHLGLGPAISKDALGLELGQAVSVIGVMAKVGGNPILLARILRTPGRIFILRNEHGLPVRSLIPRGSSPSEKQPKGGQ